MFPIRPKLPAVWLPRPALSDDRFLKRHPAGAYLFFFALFAAVVFATHAPFFDLPYYWDELGQFIPASLDLYREGAWVPHSTVPNVHPPGVMAYLAAAWRIAGCSPAVTRAAMLLLASLAVLFAFLLAIELCRQAPGAPALAPAFWLCVSPLFFAQAMLAQLDMPAMLFTTAALLLFLQDRPAQSAGVCTALVLVKETGLIVPAVFAACLLWERRRREALWFLAPSAALAVWIAVLYHATGNPLGNAEFTRYNLYYLWRPARLATTVLRRLHYLFVADFHWIGTAAILFAWRHTPLFRTRAWRVAWLIVAAHIVALSMLGGAALERYLLPVLPVVYAAMAAALAWAARRVRVVAIAAIGAGLAAGIFWNPPYPFPPENNLAFTDFVRLHQAAAAFLEQRFPARTVATAWPLSSALRRPEMGYVTRRRPVRELMDFRPAAVRALDWNRSPVFVLFSRTWDPPLNLMRWSPVRHLWSRYWDFEPDITPLEVQAHLPLRLVARFERRGQWIEVYAATPILRSTALTTPSHRER